MCLIIIINQVIIIIKHVNFYNYYLVNGYLNVGLIDFIKNMLCVCLFIGVKILSFQQMNSKGQSKTHVS